MKPYDKIILISLDTLRSDCLGANPFKLFPNEYELKNRLERSRLDEVLERSAFFANTISVAPYTSASHAAYFSGKWQKNNGIYDQFNSKLAATSIFEIAKQQGYDTIFKTDFPLVLGKYLGLSKGVDHYFIEDDSKALAQLKKAKQAMAFFHFGQIHYPYGFHSLKYGGQDYKDKVVELEKKYNITPQSAQLDDMAVETFRDEEDLQLLFRYKTIVSHLYRQGLDNDLFDLYVEGINYFHRHTLNKFLDELTSQLESERYLLVIFGDHGEAWNSATYGHHNASDEGVLRVPLLFHASDIKPQIYTSRVRTIDLFPTLLEALGKDAKETPSDGLSLSNILCHQATEAHRDAFAGVWVNELPDIIKKTDEIFSKDGFEADTGRSIQYNACFYKGDYKYVRQYKRFVNRSEILEDYTAQDLYDMSTLDKPKPIEDAKRTTEMEQALSAYTDIQAREQDASEQLRGYFNLQGYHV